MKPIKPNLLHYVPSHKAVAKAAAVIRPPAPFAKPVAKPAASSFQRNLQRVLRILQDLYGVGEESSKELVKELFRQQLLTTEMLAEVTSGQIRTLLKTKSIYNNLPLATREDLDNNPLPRIPRELIEVLDKHIKTLIPKTCKFVIAGSYIRGAKDSGDIDAVLNVETKTWDQFRNLVNKSSVVHIKDPFSSGENKVASYWEYKLTPRSKLRQLGMIERYVDNNIVRFKVDCFLATSDTWIPTMLYAIGSGEFNRRMRMIAKRKGYLLNQYGIYNRGETKPIPIQKEEDIFKILGLAWRPPEQRKI